MDYFVINRALKSGGSTPVALNASGDLCYGRRALVLCDRRDADAILYRARGSLSQEPGQLGLSIETLTEKEVAQMRRIEDEEGW